MRNFTDSKKRSWSLDINVGCIKRVLARLPGVDLANPTLGSPPLMTRLSTDVVLFVDVLFAILEPQVAAQNVTDIQFGEELGDGISAAIEAFWEEMADFFIRIRRAEIAAAVRKNGELMVTAVAASETKIKAIDVAGLVNAAIGELSMNAPGSVA